MSWGICPEKLFGLKMQVSRKGLDAPLGFNDNHWRWPLGSF